MTDELTPRSVITFLKTRDLEQTTRFYCDVLGFELALDQSTCRIFRACPNAYLGFCLTDGETGGEQVVITLEIDEVDQFCHYLENRGVAIELRPRHNERFNIYQMFVRDPNGYLVEIQRFLDPRWHEQRIE